MDEELLKTTRIVLLGKSGTGKSSLCNTLFGEIDLFTVSDAANSETHLCQSFTKTIDGRNIQLVDTPGFFDTESNELKSELFRSIVESAPGPHAFLLVFRIGRFTPQETDVVKKIINEYFGEEALKYTTVVFTHGDDLHKGMKVEEWMNGNKLLENLMEKCQNRCCVFDNKHWNKDEDPYRNNQIQIKKLLDIIDQTVRQNRGEHYTNDMLQEEQEQKEMRTDQLTPSSPNISEEEVSMTTRKCVCNFQNNIKSVVIGAILGAVLGGAVPGAALVMKFVAGGAGAAVGAAGGAVVSHCDVSASHSCY